MAAATSVEVPSSWPKDVRPPITSFAPCIWADFFTSFSLEDEVQEKYAEAIEVLKDEVKSMLMAEGNTRADQLVLIDTLERLGVAYHFNQEIEEQLQEIFKFHLVDEEYDLFTTALQFRLLRQHRHIASGSVFDKFKGEDNKFSENLNRDAKGLLSLYEAAHLRIHGEDILEEAVAFTTQHLNRIIKQLESPLQDQVKRALEMPLHRGLPRIETRYFISFYEKSDSKNESLLKLAKLDFNYVQNIYKKELSKLSRWWIELDLKAKLPYVRDRVVECYFWAVLLCFEPQYSNVRVLAVESLQLTSLMDDTYDNYATLEEAELFNEILQRWDVNEVDRLPEYMKVVYTFILSLFDKYEHDMAKQGRSFGVPYAKEAVKQLSRAYLKELNWFMGRELPTFEEYFANTIITSCTHVYYTIMFLGMESASLDAFDWLMRDPKILIASSNVCRLLDNIPSYEREKKGGAVLTALDIYMKQHGVSIQETKNKFFELAEEEWKAGNTEWIMNTSFMPKNLVEQIFNYARAGELTYRVCPDGYTNPEKLKPYVVAAFVDPIII